METISGRPSPPVPRKKQILREVHDYFFVAIGILMYALGWTIFELPIEITGGGVPGISSVVYYATLTEYFLYCPLSFWVGNSA